MSERVALRLPLSGVVVTWFVTGCGTFWPGLASWRFLVFVGFRLGNACPHVDDPLIDNGKEALDASAGQLVQGMFGLLSTKAASASRRGTPSACRLAVKRARSSARLYGGVRHIRLTRTSRAG